MLSILNILSLVVNPQILKSVLTTKYESIKYESREIDRALLNIVHTSNSINVISKVWFLCVYLEIHIRTQYFMYILYLLLYCLSFHSSVSIAHSNFNYCSFFRPMVALNQKHRLFHDLKIGTRKYSISVKQLWNKKSDDMFSLF